MKETRTPLFDEKQKSGYNRFNLLFRLALAAFCFIAYYFTERREDEGNLLLLLGLIIIALTIALFFVTHLHTSIYENSVELTGPWSMAKVKIDFSSIASVEKIDYDIYHLTRTAYNLHHKGTIRFYTHGKAAIKLTDKDGLNYIIGTQRPDEFLNIVKEQIKI